MKISRLCILGKNFFIYFFELFDFMIKLIFWQKKKKINWCSFFQHKIRKYVIDINLFKKK